MINALRAELRKLASVRSTYILTVLALVLTGFISLYGFGYKGGSSFGSGGMEEVITTSIGIASVFMGIIAILLICHEYRYNTIYYTLTASNSRLKVLLAKMIVVGVYALFFTIIVVVWNMAAAAVGLQIGKFTMDPQDLAVYSILWKTIAFTVGGAWLGLVLGFLSRSLVFAIVAYFMIPTIEPILHGLLKISNNYLPTAAQNQILQNSPAPDAYTPLASLGVFAVYLTVGFIVSGILFVRRDAN